MGQATEKQKKFANNIAGTLGLDLPEEETFESLREFISSHNEEYYRIVNELNLAEIKRNISILDVAQELGFTVVRKGRYFSLKEHDSVIIDPDKNFFWRNSEPGKGSSIGKGDSVIGFAEMFSGKSRREIMEDFSQRVKNIGPENRLQMAPINENAEKKKNDVLELPKESDNMRRVYAYLIKSRMIDPEIVQEMVDRKMLYQSMDHGNCVFVSRDENGTPVFACMRGTNTSTRFVGDVSGCDYEKGCIIDNHADKLIVTESYIDAMSIMTILKAQGIDHRTFDYMPLAGAAKFDAVTNYLQKNKKDVLCAFDADEGGRKNLAAFKNSVKEKNIDVTITEHFPQHFKDWNEELQNGFRKMKVSEVNFFQENHLEKEMEPAAMIQQALESNDKDECKKIAKKLFPELPELSLDLTDIDFEYVINKVSAQKDLSNEERIDKICCYEKLWNHFEKLSNEYVKKNDTALNRALRQRAELSVEKTSRTKGIEL